MSKGLGLGVRGIGGREIEVERLPTGQPAVRLHGRAERRANRLRKVAGGTANVVTALVIGILFLVQRAMGLLPFSGSPASTDSTAPITHVLLTLLPISALAVWGLVLVRRRSRSTPGVVSEGKTA